MKNTLRLAGLLTILIVGSGCAAPISGEAKPGMTPVDLAALKTGATVTEPTTFELKFSDTAKTVRLIEGRRLLNVLIQPIDVDPELTTRGTTRVFADGTDMSKDDGLPEMFKAAVTDNNFIAGVTASRTNGSVRNSKGLHLSVLHFATAQDSKNAAAAMYQVSTTGENPRQPVTIPGYSEANGSSKDGTAVSAFQAHGPFVIVVSMSQETPDSAGLATKIKKTLDLQIPALDKYRIIAPDDLLDLPLDPDGIMRRATGKSPSGDPYGMSYHEEDFGTFEPSGILHFERNPAEARTAFDEAGVDLVGRRFSTVYRTRDVESAFKLQTVLAKRGKSDTELAPPPGIADAQCLRLEESDPNRAYNGICVLVYDRYVAVVMSLATVSRASQQVDATLQERTAAQYAILKKSE
ncbi:hypothetical protein ACFU44_15480 [Nocardia rhizosphaerihabitans]|uniref:DUF7373 family lipoprotein n=1 Tax=Nocardia rhizosphaerihabitans TaxID=1691570 RepID=UPI00366DC608